MQLFGQIAALSLEYVSVWWNTDGNVDPTGQTGSPALVVQFAFPVSSGNPAAPAEPVTWFTGKWALGTSGRGYLAQCLVGPGGGVIVLTAGNSYDVWSKIVGSPETPVRFAGTLGVY